MVDRQIACIDISDFDKRAHQIAAELALAATEIGFLQVRFVKVSDGPGLFRSGREGLPFNTCASGRGQVKV